MEQLNNYLQSPADKSECTQVPLASDQAYIKFKEFLTDLSDIERETKLEEKYLKENFRLKEINSTLELNVVDSIYNTIVQKNRQMTDKRMKKNWTDDETSLLLWIVRVISDRKDEDPVKFTDETWMEIAKMIPFKAFENCKLRWLYLKKNSVQCTPWTEEEDQKLKEIIQKKGSNSNKWNEIAKDLYKENTSVTKTFRKGKQCRERWNNHLDPDMKRGQWTDEEDLHLLQLSYENGSKWSYIAKQLKERTENAVKNRYKSLLRKEEKENKTQNQQSLMSLSQSSNLVISSNVSQTVFLTPTFAQSMKTPPTSNEQNKIYNIIIKLMNKISYAYLNPQSVNQIKSLDERIEEEDSEDECDDQNEQDEQDEGESHSEKSNFKNQNKKKNSYQKQSTKEQQKEEKILQQQRKSSNDTEMQIETKNENTPTAANTDCNTTEIHSSDNKVTTQSTIFTPSSSPNRACSLTKNEDDINNRQHVYPTSIFGQKNEGESYVNQDEVTTANNIGQTNSKKAESKAKKPAKQPRKKKQDNNSTGSNTDEAKKGSVSTFSDALMLQPISSLSRSSSPSLANNNNGEMSCKNAKKKRQQKLEKIDIMSQTTASTATNRDCVLNSKKMNEFVQRNSIKSCSTPLSSGSGFNHYYSSNAAPSPSTLLINQLNGLHIHSTENTPSSANAKRRNTFSSSDFQSAVNLENIQKRRYFISKMADDESENSQEEEKGQRTKKIIVLAGNGNKIYGGDFNQNIATIEESDENTMKKMEIEQDSMSQNQIIAGLSLSQQNILNSQIMEDNNVNNENLNSLNIIKKSSSSQSSSNNLKFSGNNSAFKQFSSSPLQGSIFKPQQIIQSASQQSPLSNSSLIVDNFTNSPLNSQQLLIQQLSQCMEYQQQNLQSNKISSFSSICSPLNKQQSTLIGNLTQQMQSTSKPEFQNKGFQKNKNFKQASLFQPTNPQPILTSNQQ